MKKRIIRCMIVMLPLFLVSCSVRTSSPAETHLFMKTERPTLIVTSLLSETRTRRARATLVPAPATPSPTTYLTAEIPAFEPNLAIERDCLSIFPGLPQDHRYPGMIAVAPMRVQEHSYQLNNLMTGENREIPGERNFDFIVSPDRKFYAYRDYPAKKLMVFSSDGRFHTSIDWEEEWGGLTQWQDNQQVLIAITNQIALATEKYPRTLLVVNPFTNERQLLPPDYPNIDQASVRLDWWGSGTTSYDSTLTRVVYPGPIEGQGMGYILFDIPSRTKLAELPSPGFGNVPRWFYDGSRFTINGPGGEFFIVTRDGQVSQVTHMNSKDELTKHGNHSEFYTWSPNGKYLALWLISREPEITSLAIINTANGEVTDFCVSPGYNPMILPYAPFPIWSPDGKALVVGANFRPDDNGNDVVLIDIEKKAAYKIISDHFPVGWLISP